MSEPAQLVGDVERLLDDIDRVTDPVARATATELVSALVELYGAGLERIVDAVAARDAGGELAAALAADDLVAHLLLLHGLHPIPVRERVLGALEEVRAYLGSHAGDVELVAVEDRVVRLRLRGSCHGCPSSAVTLKLAIEEAIQKAAPEIEEVVAVDEEPAPALLQIEHPWANEACPAGAVR